MGQNAFGVTLACGKLTSYTPLYVGTSHNRAKSIQEEAMQYQLDIFLASLNDFWGQVATFFPKLLAVIVILFFGWLLAKAAPIRVKRVL